MSQALTVRQNSGITNLADLQQVGQIFVKSGFFADTKDAAQAMVKVMAGAELGFSPIASMTGIYIVKGKVSLSANLMAAAIKRSGRYNYRVAKGHPTADVCEITFLERIDGKWEEIGTSAFTKTDAAKAQTQNMDKFARNMLFARAMSNGARWYCADIFGGPAYTPDELGATINEDGDVIDVPVTKQKPVPADVTAQANEDEAAEFTRHDAIDLLENLWTKGGKPADEWSAYCESNLLSKTKDELLALADKWAEKISAEKAAA
jgi:hypothetical protein